MTDLLSEGLPFQREVKFLRIFLRLKIILLSPPQEYQNQKAYINIYIMVINSCDLYNSYENLIFTLTFKFGPIINISLVFFKWLCRYSDDFMIF